MTNTVGRVDFTATLDGRRTPKDAENIGRKAGVAAADGYDKEWSKSFRDSLTKSGQRSFDAWEKNGRKDGGAYGSALTSRLEKYLVVARKNFEGLRLDPGFLDDFLKKYDDAGLAAGDLQRQLVTLNREGEINKTVFEAAKRQVDYWALAQKDAGVATNDSRDALAGLRSELRDASAAHADFTAANDRAAKNLEANNARLARSQREILAFFREEDQLKARAVQINEELARSQDKVTKANATQEHGWKSLSHNTRQWTLIIGAIATAGEDIAVLGSAAGAGLFALGGAAASAVAGLGGVIATIITLNKEIDDLPRDLRGVANEFKAFTPVFGELREAVARGAFGQIAGDFDTLGRSLRSLTPELTSLGTSVGNVFSDFVEGTREGSDGLEEIRASLRLAGGNFEDLAGAAGTWGLALLRSFNRAQPLVEKTIGYIDELGERLDGFSRGTGFDDWMRNAEYTFSRLGPLLDATGRALNDLVTPETVIQTGEFLDDLTGFMPVLGDLLGVLGSANPFGLLAQALHEAGDALDPLMPALDDLAEALSEAASVGISAAAQALTALATAAAPVIQVSADFISALPPEVLAGIAAGIGGVGLAMGSINAAGAIAQMAGYTAAAQTAGAMSTKLSSLIKTGLGKAGLWGAVAAGAFGAAEGIKMLAREISGVEDQAKDFVASGTEISNVFRQMNSDLQGNSLVGNFEDLGAAIGRLPEVGHGVTGVFANIGLAFDEAGAQALALSGTLGELDGPLADLANNSVAAAQDKFSLWATQLGATDEQVLAMLNSMPEFKAVLEDVSLAATGTATDQQLLNLAMGEGSSAADQIRAAYAATGGQAALTADQIQTLSDKISNTNSRFFEARSASRDYQAALDELTASLTENGNTLDINTAEGRENEEALDAVAQAAFNLSAKTLEQTGSQQKANDAIRTGRSDLIDLADQFGWTQAEAEAYANALGLIPENINTRIDLDKAAAQKAIDTFISSNNGKRITVWVDPRSSGNVGGAGMNMYATGGTVNGAQHAIVGEAGPEAIVPLNRPLSQVDPSVRWLSAIAQGKNPQAFASGGIAGSGRQTTVNEGAIVVNDISGDPRRTANEVLQRLAEDVVG